MCIRDSYSTCETLQDGAQLKRALIRKEMLRYTKDNITKNLIFVGNYEKTRMHNTRGRLKKRAEDKEKEEGCLLYTSRCV